MNDELIKEVREFNIRNDQDNTVGFNDEFFNNELIPYIYKHALEDAKFKICQTEECTIQFCRLVCDECLKLKDKVQDD